MTKLRFAILVASFAILPSAVPTVHADNEAAVTLKQDMRTDHVVWTRDVSDS